MVIGSAPDIPGHGDGFGEPVDLERDSPRNWTIGGEAEFTGRLGSRQAIITNPCPQQQLPSSPAMCRSFVGDQDLFLVFSS